MIINNLVQVKYIKVTKPKWRRHLLRLVSVVFLASLIIQSIYFSSTWTPQAGALSGSDTVYVDGDHSVNFANLFGGDDGTCAGGTHCDRIDESSLKATDYAATGFATSYTAIDEFTVEDPTVNGVLTSVSKVDVVWYGLTDSCRGTGGTTCDNMLVSIYIDGAAVSAQTQTLTLTGTTYTTTFTGSWSTADDLRIKFQRQTVGGGGGTTSHDDVILAQAYSNVYFSYNKTKPALSLEDYIWENNDGSDSQQSVTGSSVTASSDGSNIGTWPWTDPQKATYDSINTESANIQNVSGTDTEYLLLEDFEISVPLGSTIDGIEVGVEKYSGDISSTFYDLEVFIRKNGSTLSNDKSDAAAWTAFETLYNYGGSSDLWGLTLTAEEVNNGLDFLISAEETSGLNNADPYINYVRMTVYYTPPQSTQLEAANTPITVRKGETATLRANLRNVGGIVDIEKLGLFYDRNDGIWRKVDNTSLQPTGTPSGCDDSAWNCIAINAPSGGVRNPKVAIDNNGTPWISYLYNNSDLYVARYVGSGGTGCSLSTAWTCTLVDSTNFNSQSSIAFDNKNSAWITYGNFSDGDTYVARYVGSGGSGCDTASWSCQAIYAATNAHNYMSIAIRPDGNPVVALQDGASNNDLIYAQFLGGATNGTGCAVNTWTCTTVMTAGDVGVDVEVAVDNDGNAWIAHRDTANSDAVWVSYYDGDTSSSGCANNAWTCTLIQTTNSVPNPSIAIKSDGTAYISFRNGDGDLELAEFVSSGGTGCNSATWDCNVIDSTGSSLGLTSDMAVDPGGNLYIVHLDAANGKIRLARQHQGLTSGTGCVTTSWTCSALDSVDTSNTNITYGVAIDQKGKAWVAYNSFSDANLYVATLDRAGEINIGNNKSFSSSNTLSESHTDMTSTTDSSNRNDADCTTSATWNSGKHFSTSKGAGLAIADGQSTAQCTEVAWTIDTSQAVAGETYRFIVATDDSVAQSKGFWRGPIDVQNYPTLLVEDESLFPTTQWIEKSNQDIIDPCLETAGWGCEYMYAATQDVGFNANIKSGPDGKIWTAFEQITSDRIVVGEYYGTGGKRCDSAPRWNCTVVDNGDYASLAIDSTGRPWLSYYDITGAHLRVAYYDGDNDASGCISNAWTCTTVDDTVADVGEYSGIAINLEDKVWISYFDDTNGNLKVAEFVGSGGTGCATGVTTWTCKTVHARGTADILTTSIAIGPDGYPWVSYKDLADDSIRYAKFVGSGGTGCAIVSWRCGLIADDASLTTEYNDVKFAIGGPNNKVYAFFTYSSGSAQYAEYVGTGGSGCGTGITEWACATIDTGASGNSIDGAFDAVGNLWVAYGSATVRVAKLVGDGNGSGCTGSTGTRWVCTSIDSGVSVSREHGITFDSSGAMWVLTQYNSVPRYNMAIYKYDFPQTKPTRTAVNHIYEFGKHGFLSGGATRLGSGRSPFDSTTSGCLGNNGATGYCGIASNDGEVDNIYSRGRTSPVVTMGSRFTNNSSLPTVSWIGKTNLAPSTASSDGDIELQVYRFGTTNAWETVKTNSTSSDCSSDNCTVSGMPSGTVSEYYEANGSNYWVYFRVIQHDRYGVNIVFETDSFSAHRTDQRLRTGGKFNRALNTPLTN